MVQATSAAAGPSSVRPEGGSPGAVVRPATRDRLPVGIFRLTVYNVNMSGRPLQEPTFLLLTALAERPQHGYGIMTDVERISGGRVKLRAGTLYAALDRVVAEGLVEADREEVVDGRLRRYYRLTPLGGDRLAAEAERLRQNAAVAAKRLNLRHRAIGDLP
jgi:DNA-binding PadR family transcriptional regulator